MKKYLFIIPSLSKGGAERVVSLLGSELINHKKEVVIITHFKTEKDYYVDKNVKVICLTNLFENEYRKKLNIFYLIKLLYKLRKCILSENPDYILPFLWTTCVRTHFSLLFSKQNKKVIQTVRNNPSVYPKNTIVRFYRNMLIKKSKMTIVQNESQKSYFSEKSQKNIYVLPNPVSSELFNIKMSNKNDKFNIVGVGRLENQKNFTLLIKAFSEVYKNNKDIVLNIYGEGSQRENLQHLIDNLGIHDVANLCGRSNQYNKIYGEANLYVLSSNFEGMPNTLMEAMAVGLPCIATDCPDGPRDIIENKKNGILIEMNNIEELKEAIEYLIASNDEVNKISKNARKTIKENYSVVNICKKLIEYCEKTT